MTKYRLGDYTVQNWNDWDRVPRMPQAAYAYVLTATSSVLLASAAYVAVTIGISMVTSWAISALSPKPDFGAIGSSGLLVNNRDAIAPQDFVYGKVRKGGVVTFMETTGAENKYLHQIIVLAGHEIEAVDAIYVNDEIVSLDSSGFVNDATWIDEDDILSEQKKVRILYHLGDQADVNSPFANSASSTLANTLIAESSVITGTSFVGEGLAYIYVRYRYDQDVFANGVPVITAAIRGKKVYDPRTDTTAYTNNAALCVRDFITSAYGLNDNAIDDVSFAAAANECDEEILLYAGGTEKRYEINGVVRSDRAIGDVLQDMTTACAGTLFWGSGYWKLKAGAYSAPVKTLTLDDLRGPISLDTRVSMRDNFNTVRGTFIDAEQDWISADYPAIESEAFKAEDGGEEVSIDLSLPYTTSAAAAQRIAKLTLYRGREQMTLSAEFGLNAFDLEVGDIVAFTNERYGFDEKEFEVVGWRFAASSDAGDLRVSLTLRETSEAAFDWNAEETAITGNNTNLPSALDVQTPFLGTPVSQALVNNDGTVIPSILFLWSVTEPSMVDYYKFQWRIEGDTDWNSITTTETRFNLSPILSNEAYEYRVCAVNQFGVSSAFATGASSVDTPDDGSIPNAPSNLTAYAGYKYIGLTWDAPTQNTDLSAIKDLFAYKIFRNTENNFATATVVARTGATAYTDTGLSDEATLYYWITAVDFSNNESSQSAPATTTTLAAPEGTRGAGRWNIGVTTLPSTSSEANTAFVADVGDPVDRDQAWFYTGTQSAPTSQNVWIYNETTLTWTEQTEVIDGSLLVAGTITADRLEAQSLSALGMTIGSLSDNPTGERIVISDSKIEVYDSTNTLRVVLGDLS